VSSALASLSGIALRGRRSWIAVALLASLLPAFGLRAWSRFYADALGTSIASWLIAVVPMPAPVLDEQSTGAPDPRFEADEAGTVQSVALDSKRPRSPTRARGAGVQRGIRVSSAQVLALAARRAMPSAVFVKATAQRPSGLLLSGVSALGVGLQDGDVLTEAAGQKASSVATVVGLVLAARARKDPEISGRFFRGSLPFLLTVEQPYPKGPVPG